MAQRDQQLNEMEKKYALGRAMNLTPANAAIEAGYSPKNIVNMVARLKKRERVNDEIARLKLTIALEEGDMADIKEVKQFLTQIMRAGSRDARAAADSLKDLHLREKGNDHGNPKPLFMASLLECDLLTELLKKKPPMKVMMGNYQPAVDESAQVVEGGADEV